MEEGPGSRWGHARPEQSIRDEFTHQTETFARQPGGAPPDTLDALVEMAPAEPEARWLELACGPAAISPASWRRGWARSGAST